MGSFTPYEKANPLCISALQNQSVSRSVSKKNSLKRSKSDLKKRDNPSTKEGLAACIILVFRIFIFYFPICFLPAKTEGYAL